MNNCASSHADTGKVSDYETCCNRVAGTTIDNKTLLSTDYFNSFNEVIMLLGLMADMPEALEDIHAWKFHTYVEHFRESGLSVGPLAIEAYDHSPSEVRERFEYLVAELRQVIDEARNNLKPAKNDDERRQLKLNAAHYARTLQNLVEAGSGIVHGSDMKMDQSAIDDIF